MKKVILPLILSFGVQAVELKDTLASKLWHIENKGQILLQASGDTTREHVEGIKGYDVNFLPFDQMKVDPKREVVVALIDSGVDRFHPDLKGRIWFNSKVCQEGETDHNKPCWGYNALEKTADISDDTGHGTHLAGLIAANHDAIGIAGIAHPQIKILPIKVVNQETNGFVYKGRMITDVFADGIRYAVESGADVINMSLGWPKLVETPKMKKAIEIALQKNIPIIVAAGNNSKEIPTYPCSSKGVICIGAMTNNGEVAEFSNYGGKVDFLAPGDGMVSTVPLKMESRILRIKGYDVKKGTSQAAPLVTALAATLKLLEPEITNDELYARLALSSHSYLADKRDHKFVKFGLIDMQKASSMRPKIFVAPDFKDILEVNIDEEGHYRFLLPLKNYLNEATSVKAKISMKGKGYIVDQSKIEVGDLKSGEETRIMIEGHLENLALDSQTYLEVELSTGEFISKSQTMISFAKELSQTKGKLLPLEGIRASQMAYIKDGRKLSLLKPIADKFRFSKFPEYFLLQKEAEGDTTTQFQVIREREGKMESQNFSIPLVNSILAIFRVDINNDGKGDYFVYTINKEQTDLQFHLLNDLGQPLFAKHSIWNFPITTFEGLPLKAGFLDDFLWVNVKSAEFGNVKVPLISKEWFVPEADNTSDILDRMPDVPDDHIYYLNPLLKDDKVKMDLRIVDSYDFREKLKKALKIPYRNKLKVEKPLPQTRTDIDRGEFRLLVSVGREFDKQYYQFNFKTTDSFAFTEVQTDSNFISQNAIYPVLAVDSNQVHAEQTLFMTLFDRTKARLFRLDQKGDFERREFVTRDWSDPVFQHIASFNDEDSISFLEARYHIYGVDKEGRIDGLTINRDSSFPGVNFSETLEPLVVTQNNRSIPAVFVNSTLIFGERLYVMTMTDGKMTRPAALSVNLPERCVRLDPARLENDQSSFAMLCVNRADKVTFHYIPMTIP